MVGICCWFFWLKTTSCGLTFQGLRIQSGDGLTSPPSINRMGSFGWKSHLFSSPKNSCFKFIPFRCYVFLLHQVEERKGKDEDGGNGRQALTDWEPGWHDIAIIVIWLLWNVSHRDRMSLSGLIWRVPSSSRLIHLVSGLPGPVSILTLRVLLFW